MASSVAWQIEKFEKDGFPKRSEIRSLGWDVIQYQRHQENNPEATLPIKDFYVIRELDKHSHLFHLAESKGERLGTIKIFYMRGSEKTPEVHLSFTFEECLILGIRVGGNPNGFQDILISFERVKRDSQKS